MAKYYAIYHDFAAWEIYTEQEFLEAYELPGGERPTFIEEMRCFSTIREAKALISMHLKGEIADARLSLQHLNRYRKPK